MITRKVKRHRNSDTKNRQERTTTFMFLLQCVHAKLHIKFQATLVVSAATIAKSALVTNICRGDAIVNFLVLLIAKKKNPNGVSLRHGQFPQFYDMVAKLQ